MVQRAARHVRLDDGPRKPPAKPERVWSKWQFSHMEGVICIDISMDQDGNTRRRLRQCTDVHEYFGVNIGEPREVRVEILNNRSVRGYAAEVRTREFHYDGGIVEEVCECIRQPDGIRSPWRLTHIEHKEREYLEYDTLDGAHRQAVRDLRINDTPVTEFRRVTAYDPGGADGSSYTQTEYDVATNYRRTRQVYSNGIMGEWSDWHEY